MGVFQALYTTMLRGGTVRGGLGLCQRRTDVFPADYAASPVERGSVGSGGGASSGTGAPVSVSSTHGMASNTRRTQ